MAREDGVDIRGAGGVSVAVGVSAASGIRLTVFPTGFTDGAVAVVALSSCSASPLIFSDSTGR